MKLKNDRYRKVRGGKAKILNIICSKCGNWVLKYQKDVDGSLHRCYLNRIIEPEFYSNFNNQKQMSNLECKNCNTVIGIPMIHTDHRLAYRLIKGNFRKEVWV